MYRILAVEEEIRHQHTSRGCGWAVKKLSKFNSGLRVVSRHFKYPEGEHALSGGIHLLRLFGCLSLYRRRETLEVSCPSTERQAPNRIAQLR